ncbi:hypothetical protein [Nonomuraea candida]|uniref:hypothetical protein n=1 Tax=Nonomuraea candida TaxID=359159 RepID=UPI0005BDCEC5|nr:hypothetical protein [Nonomuraea candida]
MSTLRRLLTRTAALLCVAVLCLGGAAVPASSSSLLVECPTGYQTNTYNPGLLLLTSRNVTIHSSSTIGNCVDVIGNRATGEIDLTGTGSLTCVGGNASGTATVDWNHSGIPDTHFSWSGAAGLRPGGNAVLVITGTVTSNDMPGAGVLYETVLTTSLQQTLGCLGSGQTTNSGAVLTFSILDL